jgi:hypothetical protein
MKYFVTFGTIRTKTGPNPLGHSCIWLSKTEEATNKLRVTDVWGFYGVSSAGNSQSWRQWIKIQTGLDVDVVRHMKTLIGLDVDFDGNHGFLRHEEPRFLEMNSDYYLHGTTFELSKEKFDELTEGCINTFKNQMLAIEEAAKALKVQPKDNPQFQESCRL